MSSTAPSLGMPGGSWTLEEEEPAGRCVPQNSDSRERDFTPEQSDSGIQKLKEPQTVHSEIVVIDPAQLSEEIVLLASPTSTTTKVTLRVRMSPGYGIQQVFPQVSEDGIVLPPIQDSPEQRRSLRLSTIYPDFEDAIRSASRSSTNKGPVSSVLDMEWDFAQFDVASVPDGRTESEEIRISPEFQQHEIQDHEHLPDCGLGLLGLDLTSSSVEAVEGETCDEEVSMTESAPRNSDLSTPARLREESSLDSDIHSIADFSRSAPAPGTPSSVPSTARPLVSPMSLRSTLRIDDDVVSSDLGDLDNSEEESRHSEETTDERLLLTSSSLVDTPLADGHDSVSLHSMILRPATTSLVSEDGVNNGEQGDSDPSELEYLDESPSLSALGLDDTSLPLSLGIHFEVPTDWEVLSPLQASPSSMANATSTANSGVGTPPHPRPNGQTGEMATESAASSESSEGHYVPHSAVQSLPENPRPEKHSAVEAPGDGLVVEAAALSEPLHLHVNEYLVSNSVVDAPQVDGSATPEDGANEGAKEAAPSLEELRAPSSSDDQSSSSLEPTPELPALDFEQSPSLTDEVLRSPGFHAVLFGEYGPGIETTGPAPVVPRSRHSRALSAGAGHIERTSILWAPEDSKRQYDSARGATATAKEKGKGRARPDPRARTVSDDSGFTQGERVEREVQTEADDLRARYRRVKNELKKERVKIARLVREGEPDGWEVRWMSTLLPWVAKDEDDIL
ncbi:hypothetical protein DFH09DRAFT_554934 [Mycena vulgaris]|nr:hypothetical protein DFH09DRAFT_554934 [Mycena vulgaris]